MKYVITLCLVILSLISSAHPFTPCEDGSADIFACNKIDLLTRIHLEDMGTGSGSGSDIWGWTDPLDGKEYALMGLSTGTAFIDISTPTAPVYLGFLPTATSNSTWRDIKTLGNYAYIVSEASGHGMQIFDLTQLRSVPTPPVNFSADANYNEFGNAHNIVINESSGFAYAVGTSTCSGGLHMMDLTNPLVPVNQGCFSSDGYTHDAQCVMYIGPDIDHSGKEICVNSNEDTVTVVDVTDKNSPVQISRTGYTQTGYTHQGWLTEDHRYYLMNDELDEQNFGHNTKTYIWDMLDLDAPQVIGTYVGPQPSIDHNLYIKDNFAYLSNYTSGLSVVDITDIGNSNLVEVANFDTYPANNSNVFNGAWSNYPYFESGTVVVSDISNGLFILGPMLCPEVPASTNLLAQANGDNSIELTWTDTLAAGETYKIYRSEGGCNVDNFVEIADQITSEQFIDDTVSGMVANGYKVVKVNADGTCESERSVCSEAVTTGVCTAAPSFSGITSVSSNNAQACGLTVAWNDANSYCGSSITYNVYKSTDPAFSPAPENKVKSIIGNSWIDFDVLHNQNYYYLVQASDNGNGNSENNQLKQFNKPTGKVGNGTWSSGAEVGDSGLGQNTARHLGWELVTDEVFSGERSYWSQNEHNACNRLVSDPMTLTLGESTELSFQTFYDIESRWDGGVLEVSSDGENWNQPILSPTYPDTFRSSSDACQYATDTPAFSGASGTWQQHTADLSAYQGEEIMLRFSYSSDSAVTGAGWYIDDISMTNVQIAGYCETVADLIFQDDFE
jgi:choice-of-anchor B domain-containing protein